MLRVRWEAEMSDLLEVLTQMRSESDEAQYFVWRQNNYIVSPALLCANVLELRVAKARAIKQKKYKEFIDKIKLIRKQLTKHTTICKLARVESSRSTNYYFNSRKEARCELQRVLSLDAECCKAKEGMYRSRAKIACPMGHGMVCMLPNDVKMEKIRGVEEVKYDQNGQLSSNSASSKKNKSNGMNVMSDTSEVKLSFDAKINSLAEIFDNSLPCVSSDHMLPESLTPLPADYPSTCMICHVKCLNGNTCTICEYTLCQSCSVIFCRQSHRTQIWTLPEAQGLFCNACKTEGLTAGYRCLECNVDICDMCTLTDARNALKQWPFNELKRLIGYIELAKDESVLAREFCERDVVVVNKAGNAQMSMTALCVKLYMVRALQAEIERELGVRRLRGEREVYALTCGDL